MTQGSEKCGTTTCEQDATTVVFWPGQTIRVCTACALRLGNVAVAMGFVVEGRPLSPAGGEL